MPSWTFGPLTEGENHHLHSFLHESPEHGNVIHYGAQVPMNFQCHMIAHIDYVS